MIRNVVIVGKPNVGKSQLFNRLTGEKHSIVFPEPGITRDRVSLNVEWCGKNFLLTDTGGYTSDLFSFQDEINRQTEIAVSSADLILFVVSCKDGIDQNDIHLSKLLKKKKLLKVILVANKCDCLGGETLDEYRLGMGDSIHISAEHGINTGILLDEIVKRLNLETSDGGLESRYRLSIIGKPNVGKSTFVNTLLKESRVITSDVSGTTRDAIDLNLDYGGKKYLIIDTPGIRRHSSIKGNDVDKFSLLRSKKAIARSDLILFTLDISESIHELDERVGGLVYKSNIPTVIVANKWDLMDEKTDSTRRKIEKEIRKRFKFLFWAPIVFISAEKGEKIDGIFKKIEEVRGEAAKKINPVLLSNFLRKVSSLYSVPTVKGQKLKMFSMSQVESQIPTFLISCSNPELLHFSYSRLIENQIRLCFGYKISPIKVIYKKNF